MALTVRKKPVPMVSKAVSPAKEVGQTEELTSQFLTSLSHSYVLPGGQKGFGGNSFGKNFTQSKSPTNTPQPQESLPTPKKTYSDASTHSEKFSEGKKSSSDLKEAPKSVSSFHEKDTPPQKVEEDKGNTTQEITTSEEDKFQQKERKTDTNKKEKKDDSVNEEVLVSPSLVEVAVPFSKKESLKTDSLKNKISPKALPIEKKKISEVSPPKEKDTPQEDILKEVQQKDLQDKLKSDTPLKIQTRTKTIGDSPENPTQQKTQSPELEKEVFKSIIPSQAKEEKAVSSQKGENQQESRIQTPLQSQIGESTPHNRIVRTPQKSKGTLSRTKVAQGVAKKTFSVQNTKNFQEQKQSVKQVDIQLNDKETKKQTSFLKTKEETGTKEGVKEKPVEEKATRKTLRVNIVKNLQQGRRLIRISLNPQHLGFVHVRLRSNEQGKHHVLLQASRPETLALLKVQKSDLLESLKQIGITVEDKDILFQLSHQTFSDDSDEKPSSQKEKGFLKKAHTKFLHQKEADDPLLNDLPQEVSPPSGTSQQTLDISI